MVDPAVVARMNALFDLHRSWVERLDPDAPDSGVPFDPEAWPAETAIPLSTLPLETGFATRGRSMKRSSRVGLDDWGPGTVTR